MNIFDIYKASNGIILDRVHGAANAALRAKQLAQELEVSVCYCNGQSREVKVLPEVSAWWAPEFVTDEEY